MSTSSSPLPSGEIIGHGGPLGAGLRALKEGRYGQNETIPLILLMQFFLFFCGPRECASASPQVLDLHEDDLSMNGC